jgi:GntR family transcriptional regulator
MSLTVLTPAAYVLVTVARIADEWNRTGHSSCRYQSRLRLLDTRQWMTRAVPTVAMSAEIDRDSPEPPWVQLAAILRARIASGEITARLPGEHALQQEFGLAPVTIRKAIHQLRDEGLVRTTPGWGTYVVKKDEAEKEGRP